MPSEDVGPLHEAAWEHLCELVSQRDKLLHSLEAAARVAMDITPAIGVVIDYDSISARDLLDAIDQLTPRIVAQMEELNGYARQIGKPEITWRKIDLRDV